jgi:hypothetical protein
MFRKKGLLLIPAVIVLTSLVAVSAAHGQALGRDAACQYTVASLQGNYSVVVNYGANIALGLWAETLDGKGNLTRTGVLNQPTPGSATGERTIGTVSSTGTYSVNCNGTGTITRVVTRPDGTTAPETDDFIITSAVRLPGRLSIATTIVDAQRVPSAIIPGGIFVTHVHTRLPDANLLMNLLFP